MTRTTTIMVLATAAALEAGGDALIRIGLQTNAVWQRIALFSLGALILFAYGWTVNSPPWDFGKLLGLYVVFFFIFAQAISWIFFKQAPTASIAVGGALIVAGGLVIAAQA
jgi:drug/metabolite transporter superfamily protein YnfA